MIAFDLTGTQEEIDLIVSVAKRLEGVEDVSEPSALDASQALNAGLSLKDLKKALLVVTLMFTTGEEGLNFFEKLRDEFQARGGEIAVSEPATGKVLGRVDAGTSNEGLARLTQPQGGAASTGR
jgi:hypothetical protein